MSRSGIRPPKSHFSFLGYDSIIWRERLFEPATPPDRKRLLTRLLLATLLFSAAGCTIKMGSLGVTTTKEFDLEDRELELIREDVVGESVRRMYLVFPTGPTFYPRLDEAIEAALEKAGGDVMTHVRVYQKWWFIPYLYGENKIEIKGDVWRLKPEAPPSRAAAE